MPQPGEVRHGSTESVQWDGQRWQPLAAGGAEGVPMHHPGEFERPQDAFINELGRTGKEAAIGLAKSPLDLLSSTFQAVRHPLDTMSNTANAVAHPLDTIKALGDDPRAGGSALGQLLLGKYAVPEIPGAVAEGAPKLADLAGRGASSVGRGMEAAGDAMKAPTKLTSLMTAASHPVAAAVEAGAPYAASAAGRGLQKLGGALQGLKGAAQGGDLMSDAQSALASGKSFDWPEAGGRYEPDAIGSHKLVPADPLADANSMTGDFAGPRTTGHFEPVNALTGKPTGLAGVTSDEMSNLGRASNAASDFDIPASWKPFLQKENWKPPYAQQPPMSLGEDIPLDLPESAPLTDAERLAARSQERFGKSYRSETTTK